MKRIATQIDVWEKLHNPNFKGVDFDPLLQIAGDNAFTMREIERIAQLRLEAFV